MKISRLYITEKSLLTAITTVLTEHITETDPYVLFNGLLDAILRITDSKYGFIGEVFYLDNNQPFIKNYAITNISWNRETHKLYQKNNQKGMYFSKLESLYGDILKTGKYVVSNQPSTDPRSCGLPQGHPPLNSFMGFPLYGSGELLGVVCIANKRGGYHKHVAESLNPFLMTCGNLIQAYRHNAKHEQVASELKQCKTRLSEFNKTILLGSGYQFKCSPNALLKNGNLVFLTKKELKLMEVLVTNRNNVCSYQYVESYVWENTIVGESSLRSLIRRLRKKLPEIEIKTLSGIGYLLVDRD
jgi:hypothetical protein